MRLMLDVPRETHRYLIEPLSKVPHIRKILIKRFLTFLDQIRKSNKNASKFLLETIISDTRSVTGSNLRNILLQTNKTEVRELVPGDAYTIKYHPIAHDDEWKLKFIHDIVEAKNGKMEVPNISDSDLDNMLTALSTS